MAFQSIDSKILKNMFITGAKYLDARKKYVNDLNVFPVPDGDTGTNMSLTILSAAKEVQSVDENKMSEIANAISTGSLRGARGNSGVILSQLLRGFAKEISNHNEIDAKTLSNAFNKGVETAYKAVMKPKEGTILTVARAIAEKATQLSGTGEDLIHLLEETLEYANDVLLQTPDMLPVLKEAGVVDAGGQGLLYIVEGALAVLHNNGELDDQIIFDEIDTEVQVIKPRVDHDIRFGYCTEFIIQLKPSLNSENETMKMKHYLESIGDSIVAVSDDEIIKIHVHTNDPGKALQKGLALGDLINIKIDNMREQHTSIHGIDKQEDIKPDEQERKEFGFVVISIGEGLSNIFTGLGADLIVEGGQTMNPSTEDIVLAVNKVNASHVFVLPNNKNIVLAANQAKDLIEDKIVHVIPTKSIPQGIAAMINFTSELSIEENESEMLTHLNDVSSGQITFAVRDTSVNDLTIHEGDIIGIGNDQILSVEKDIKQCAITLLDQLIDENSGLVTIYYGIDMNEQEAMDLAAYVEERYEECEVEVHFGGQPLYYYLLSVE